MKKSIAVFLCLFLLFGISSGCASKKKSVSLPEPAVTGTDQPAVESEIPEFKRTDLGLYISASQAYESWKLNPNNIKVLDCRTPEEYAFVGHAPMAHNIPVQFFTYQYDADKKEPFMLNNPDFLDQVKKKFKKDDTIYVMCRSGGRSAASVNAMAREGFKNVYNIIDGFEGDVINDPGSYFNGKRMRNGWKNSGAPWTYDMNPKQMYLRGH